MKSPQERFAGISPGMMLVLGEDLSHKAMKGHGTLEAQRAFMDQIDPPKAAPKWLKNHGVTLKELLGAGSYGVAFLVDHQKYGKDIVLKITTHTDPEDGEVRCAEWLEENNMGRDKGSSLPEIFEIGEFVPSYDDQYYYFRPMYEENLGQLNIVESYGNIFNETNGQFYPSDDHFDNWGQGHEGQGVYFDPACFLHNVAQDSFGGWLERILGDYSPSEVEELTGISVDKMRDFVDSDVIAKSSEIGPE